MGNSISVPYLSYNKIALLAKNFLNTYHSSDTIPIPIEEIIEFQLGIDIIPLHGLHQAFDTDGFISGDLKSISVDLFVYESRLGRYRFTLAHEIGHLTLHSKLYKNVCFNSIDEWKKFIYTFPEKEYRWFEWQAYVFVGLILVPIPHLIQRFEFSVKQIEALGISMKENKEVALDTIIDLLAKEFVCSKEVIQKRLLKEKFIE